MIVRTGLLVHFEGEGMKQENRMTHSSRNILVFHKKKSHSVEYWNSVGMAAQSYMAWLPLK